MHVYYYLPNQCMYEYIPTSFTSLTRFPFLRNFLTTDDYHNKEVGPHEFIGITKFQPA